MTPTSGLPMRGVEDFIVALRGMMYVEDGWESPLTMEHLDDMLRRLLQDHHAALYPDS